MDFRNLGNPRPGAPGTLHNDKKAPGHTAMGAFERQTHEQGTSTAKAHDALAGEMRARGESVSGTYLVVRALLARARRLPCLALWWLALHACTSLTFFFLSTEAQPRHDARQRPLLERAGSRP